MAHDAIGRVFPALTLYIFDLLFSLNWYFQSLSCQHIVIGIFADYVATVMEIVGEVAEYVTDDLGHGIKPRYLVILSLCYV